MEQRFHKLAELLYQGNAAAVAELSNELRASGVDGHDILNNGLMKGMERVGQDFKSGELFVPEIIVAARAMHAGIEALRPHFEKQPLAMMGTIVLGTVQGDLHDIGKRLVGIMMQGAGFTVVDLGHDVAPERFLRAVQEEQPDLVGLSALLSTTMPAMHRTIEVLTRAGWADRVKILVGGAPVNQTWAEQIGAHGYAPDAVTAVEVARSLLPVP